MRHGNGTIKLRKRVMGPDVVPYDIVRHSSVCEHPEGL